MTSTAEQIVIGGSSLEELAAAAHNTFPRFAYVELTSGQNSLVLPAPNVSRLSFTLAVPRPDYELLLGLVQERMRSFQIRWQQEDGNAYALDFKDSSIGPLAFYEVTALVWPGNPGAHSILHNVMLSTSEKRHVIEANLKTADSSRGQPYALSVGRMHGRLTTNVGIEALASMNPTSFSANDGLSFVNVNLGAVHVLTYCEHITKISFEVYRRIDPSLKLMGVELGKERFTAAARVGLA